LTFAAGTLPQTDWAKVLLSSSSGNWSQLDRRDLERIEISGSNYWKQAVTPTTRFNRANECNGDVSPTSRSLRLQFSKSRVRYGRDAVIFQAVEMSTRMVCGLVCSLVVMLQGSADYPAKPVRIIEPFGAGGGPDLIARSITPKLTALWGQPVTVENHPGAGSTAAPALVAQSPADGYTLLVNTSAQAYSAVLLKNLPYDPLNDFIPVAPLTSQPYVLVAGTSSGITSVRDLIAAAKAKPGELKFGSAGVGTGTHLGAEKFNLGTGIKAVHVPGNTTPEAIADTVAGRTTYLITPISYALADIRTGRLRALGVTTNTRSPLLPEVPTIAEAGVTGFDYPIWYGVWVRAGTPTGVVDKLAKDIARVLAAPDMRDWLVKQGADPMSMTQPEFAQFVVSESENAARIIKAAGIKPR
jgi:tripartite-type tricarboxylate transporter receptor subunit TctC